MTINLLRTRYLTTGVGFFSLLVVNLAYGEERFLELMVFFNLTAMFLPLSRLGVLQVCKDHIYRSGGLPDNWMKSFLLYAVVASLSLYILVMTESYSVPFFIPPYVIFLLIFYYLASSLYETSCYANIIAKVDVPLLGFLCVLSLVFLFFLYKVEFLWVSRLLMVLPFFLYFFYLGFADIKEFNVNSGSISLSYRAKSMMIAIIAFSLVGSVRLLFDDGLQSALVANVFLFFGVSRFIAFPIVRRIEKSVRVQRSMPKWTHLTYVAILAAILLLFAVMYGYITFWIDSGEGGSLYPLKDLLVAYTFSFLLSFASYLSMFSLNIFDESMRFSVFSMFFSLSLFVLSMVFGIWVLLTVFILCFLILIFLSQSGKIGPSR